MKSPKFPEEEFKHRYKEGVKEIFLKHFQFSHEPVPKQVIVLVSHHKAINRMLKFGKHLGKQKKVWAPCYCFTMYLELKTNDRRQDYEVTKINIVDL